MKWLIIAQIVALLIWYPLGQAAKAGDADALSENDLP